MLATEVDPQLILQCKAEVEQVLAGFEPGSIDTLVVSSEGFSGNPRQGYANAPIIAQILAEIFAGHSIQVVVYLRSQDSYLESIYTQWIQQGESLSFQQFVDSLQPNAFDWEQLVNAFAKTFGQSALRVRAYHRTQLPDPDSILRDFCGVVGCSFAPINDQPVLKNVSYSRDALEIALRLNSSLEDDERAALRKLLQKTSIKGAGKAHSFFPPEHRQSLMLRYADSNERVAQQYFGQNWTTLFPADSSYSAYQGLTIDATCSILVKMILDLNQNAQKLKATNLDLASQITALNSQLKQIQNKVTSLKQEQKLASVDLKGLESLRNSKWLHSLTKWEAKLRRLLKKNA